MTTKTISNAGGNSNANGAWVEGSPPSASDDIVATATSGNLTINALLSCRSVDLTGYVGTITHNTGINWSIGTTTVKSGNIALKFPVSGWTYSPSGTAIITFVSTSATQATIDAQNISLLRVTFNGTNGTWKLTSAFKVLSLFTLTAGALDTNGQTVTGSLNLSGSTTRSLTLGATTITGSSWQAATTTNLTFSGASSTIVITGNGSSFTGGGLTYGTLQFASTGIHTIVDSNTYAAWVFTTAAAATIKVTDGTTQTITNPTGLTLQGAAGQLLTLTGTSTAGYTIAVPSGSNTLGYLDISYCTATGNTLAAGATSQSTNGNNVNVTFGGGSTVVPVTAKINGQPMTQTTSVTFT